MATQRVGNIPEFTDVEETPSLSELGTEVSVSSTEKTSEPELVEEKETPSEVPPAEEQPLEVQEEPKEDTGYKQKEELEKSIEGLQRRKRELIMELDEVRLDKQKAKRQEIDKVQSQIDDLKDLHPQDVQTIERILQAKGYISKDSVNQMLYSSRKQDEIQKFLQEYREYNEVNDPEGKKFGPLLQELKLYKEPEDPTMYGVLLRRAHRAVSGIQESSGRGVAVKQAQAKIAGVGSGGSQRSSDVKSFTSQKRQWLKDGGWSDEEIDDMEKRNS